MSDQVNEIKSKTDIVSVLSEYIDLKKSGRNYKALCPFHSEKTPSFMVSPELQIYKCFGCGEGGDVYEFLQKYEGMDFYESLKFLAERVGVKLKQLSPGQKGQKQRFYEINNLAERFFSYILTKHPVGKDALQYLKKDRKIKPETIKKFGLGYSPDKPFALKKYLNEKKKISNEDLVNAGLVFSKDGRFFDRFRGRVIFSLHDHRGNTIGFAGRTLPTEKNKDLAKYINSHDTPVYHKSHVLYGLNITKKDIREKGFAVIVEGELDMISSWQVGLKNAIAIKGSALTQEQVKLLSRFTQNIVLALDADVAGDAASRRGIQIAEKEGFEIKVAKLGKYKDPDELAKNAPDKLTKCIRNAVGVWDFYIDSAFERVGAKTGTQKAKLSKELVPILSSIEDKIVQAHYVQEVARRLGISEEAVSKQIGGVRIEEGGSKPKIEESLVKKETKTPREIAEERFLSVAFRFDARVLLKADIKKLIRTALAKKILDSFLKYMEGKTEFDPSLFAAELPKELVGGFTGMILKEIGGLEDREESYLQEIEMIKENLEMMGIKEELETIAAELKEAEVLGDKKKLRKKQEDFGRVSVELKKFEGNRK